MSFDYRPLSERIKILKDEDWDEIEQISRAMFIVNKSMDMFQCEAYAMLAIIETRESGGARSLH